MPKIKQGPGFQLLTHISHLLDDRLRELLKPLDIHAGQARVIHALGRMGTASQRDLAREFNIAPASMSQMTKRLISGGFIQVQSDPNDKRASILSLTEKGDLLLEDVFAVWQQVDRIVMDAIGQDDAEQFFAQSMRLRNALGGRTPGSGQACDS